MLWVSDPAPRAQARCVAVEVTVAHIGFLGLAWETVLDGGHKRDISANNVVFTLIPAGNLTKTATVLV